MGQRKGKPTKAKLMELVVFRRQAYGTMRTYPLNEAAQLLAGLLDTKTFTDKHIAGFYKLGFQIRYELDPGEHKRPDGHSGRSIVDEPNGK